MFDVRKIAVTVVMLDLEGYLLLLQFSLVKKQTKTKQHISFSGCWKKEIQSIATVLYSYAKILVRRGHNNIYHGIIVP